MANMCLLQFFYAHMIWSNAAAKSTHLHHGNQMNPGWEHAAEVKHQPVRYFFVVVFLPLKWCSWSVWMRGGNLPPPFGGNPPQPHQECTALFSSQLSIIRSGWSNGSPFLWGQRVRRLMAGLSLWLINNVAQWNWGKKQWNSGWTVL